MKLTKIVVALLLAVSLFVTDRYTSRESPQNVLVHNGGYTFNFSTIPLIPDYRSGTFRLSVTPPLAKDHRLTFYTTGPGRGLETELAAYTPTPPVIYDSVSGEYLTHLTVSHKGGREFVYFDVRDGDGAVVARVLDNGTYPFEVRYTGDVPSWVKLGRLILLFCAYLALAFVFLEGVAALRGAPVVTALASWSLSALLFLFAGGVFPFGMARNYYAYGDLWRGVPMGDDVTETGLVLVCLYLFMLVVITFGSLTRGRWGRDVYSGVAIGRLGMIAFFLLPVLFYMRNAIMPGPEILFVASSAFIVALILIYFWGVLTCDRNNTPVVGK